MSITIVRGLEAQCNTCTSLFAFDLWDPSMLQVDQREVLKETKGPGGEVSVWS